MDHAEGDRRINEGKEMVVEKECQQFQSNSSNGKRSTVNTMSVLIIGYNLLYYLLYYQIL